jgi:hypothetical protein
MQLFRHGTLCPLFPTSPCLSVLTTLPSQCSLESPQLSDHMLHTAVPRKYLLGITLGKQACHVVHPPISRSSSATCLRQSTMMHVRLGVPVVLHVTRLQGSGHNTRTHSAFYPLLELLTPRGPHMSCPLHCLVFCTPILPLASPSSTIAFSACNCSYH